MPKKSDNKTVVVQLRLTPKEAKDWKAAAAVEDRTLSNWVRRQCNAAVA